MELKLLHTQLSDEDVDDGSEVDNLFDKNRFYQLYDKLIELKSINELGIAFGLSQETVDTILQTRIQALFGLGNAASSISKNFFGSDEQLLSHMAKQEILDRQKKR